GIGRDAESRRSRQGARLGAGCLTIARIDSKIISTILISRWCWQRCRCRRWWLIQARVYRLEVNSRWRWRIGRLIHVIIHLLKSRKDKDGIILCLVDCLDSYYALLITF